MLKREFIVFALIGILVLCTSPAFAEGHPASKERALEIVRDRSQGKIIKFKTRRDGNRNIHEVRVLTKQGRVRDFEVDARSGKILNQRPRSHASPANRR